MKHKTLRIKASDHAHLQRLAQGRRYSMVDVLAALVAEAETGRIYPPLCAKVYGSNNVKLSVSAELSNRVNALKREWGIYAYQVVSWLLSNEDEIEQPNEMDVWAQMAANRTMYEQLIAKEVRL